MRVRKISKLYYEEVTTMGSKKLKFIALIGMGLGLLANVVSDYTMREEMRKAVREEVEEEFSRRESERESE